MNPIRILALFALAVLLAVPAANAGRVPPGLTPTTVCTRPALPGYTTDIRVCAAPATVAVGSSTLITVAAVLDGTTPANGTPLFLYSLVPGQSSLTLVGSCWTFQGGCSFVVTSASAAQFVFYGYVGGVVSGGLAVSWF